MSERRKVATLLSGDAAMAVSGVPVAQVRAALEALREKMPA